MRLQRKTTATLNDKKKNQVLPRKKKRKDALKFLSDLRVAFEATTRQKAAKTADTP